MRVKGIPKKYIRVAQDMYKKSETVVRCVLGTTDPFKVEVGLHQGSALNPFLFAIVMDTVTDNIRKEAPWSMMFADDVVLCCKKSELEEDLERWRDRLEKRGMKVSRAKAEYMSLSGVSRGGAQMQGQQLPEVSEFKCTAIIGGVGAVGGGLIGAIIGSLQKSDHTIEMDIEEVSIQLLPQNQNGLGLSLVFEF